MRIIKTKVYRFNELSDSAKENAIEHYRETIQEYFWAEDGVNTLKKFCEQFDIELKDYSLDCGGYGNSNISFDADCGDMIADELVGVRVFKYLQNNYAREIEFFVNASATGYCFDCSIVQPIVKFMARPDVTATLKDLFESCFDAFIKSWNADVEYQYSDEAIIETIEANDYEFTENGKMV